MPNGKRGESHASLAVSNSAVLSLIGMSMCVAALLSLLFFSNSRVLSDILIEKVLAACAMAASFAVFYGLADRLATKRGGLAMCAIAAIGVAASICGRFVPEGMLVFCTACSCVIAIGVSSLMAMWFSDMCLTPRSRPHTYVAAAFAVGLLLCIAECFFPLNVRCIVSILALCVSCALAFVQRAAYAKKADTRARRDSRKAAARSRIQPESVIMLAVINAQFGFLAGGSYTEIRACSPCMLGAAILACIVIAIDAMGKKQRISEESIYPVTIPLTVTALVGMYLFGDGIPHIVAMCILAVIDAVYLVSGMVALSKHVILAGLSPIRTCARYYIINFLALAGGIAFGFAAGWVFKIDMVHGIQITVGAAVAYAFIASFFHKARFPDSTVKADGTVGFAPSTGKGQWKRRCFEVSERYGLSDRQNEVLFLIGQGRNAEYVAKNLTISVSTVQTHIRNIYQKLGVHSRQELLDLIEGTKLYGED